MLYFGEVQWSTKCYSEARFLFKQQIKFKSDLSPPLINYHETRPILHDAISKIPFGSLYWQCEWFRIVFEHPNSHEQFASSPHEPHFASHWTVRWFLKIIVLSHWYVDGLAPLEHRCTDTRLETKCSFFTWKQFAVLAFGLPYHDARVRMSCHFTNLNVITFWWNLAWILLYIGI